MTADDITAGMELPSPHGGFSAHLEREFDKGELGSAELFQAAENVRQLLEHPGWVFVRDLAHRHRQEVFLQLLYGKGSKSHAELAANVGELKGIGMVEAAATGVLAAAETVRRGLERLQAERADAGEG